MPDSMTKFKEDPPKKTEVVTSGGTVIIPPDFFIGNGVVCENGNGDSTVETVGVGQTDLNPLAPMALPFLGVGKYAASPYTLDGTNDPNHEVSVVGDGATVITSLDGSPGITCDFADDTSTFKDADFGEKLVITTDKTLPTGLVLETDTDADTYSISGTMTGFNELEVFEVIFTNPTTTAAPESDFIELASSRPLKDAENIPYIYYTQYSGTLWALTVADASTFLPNHLIINERGATATINHIDYGSNTLFLTIDTTSGEEFEKFFKKGDDIDMVLPAAVSAPIFGSSDSEISTIYATLLTGVNIEGAANGNDFALHFDEASGFVDTDSTGLTPADTEITNWLRCSHSPNISNLGSIDFLDGERTASPITSNSDVTNWGETFIANLVDGESQYIAGALDKLCEFSGQFTTPQPYTEITSTIINYAGQTESATVALRANDTVAQPLAVTNPYSDGTVDQAFFFHYRYVGSATDLATLIITVDDSDAFTYNSTTPDQNKISNGRGTVGTITYKDTTKLYVTLDNNDAYAFVKGDLVDNTGTFLSSEGSITNIEYTFEVGKVADATSYFEPQIALQEAADRLDIDVTGLIATPFGTSEFSSTFLKQVRTGALAVDRGSISILNDSKTIESQTIASIDLTPGNHSITLGAAFTATIQSDVNKLAYIVPLNSTELGTLSYTINSYLGISSGACGGLCDLTDDLVLMGTLGAGELIFKPGDDTDAGHGRIIIGNNITAALSTQNVVITATDVDGNSATSEFSFSVSAPPSGLSLSRNLLLNVPSASAYKVGSYISSNNTEPGLGIVKDILADKNIAGNYYLDIQLLKGSFSEFDDLDNRQEFDSQKTYVLGEGVEPYNASVETTGTATDFQDSYSCNIKNNRRFIDTGITSWDDTTATSSDVRGTVALVWDDTNTGAYGSSILKDAGTKRLYLRVERGSLGIGSTIQPSDCTGAYAGTYTVNEIFADNMFITHNNSAAEDMEAGLNITGNLAGTDKSAGVVHSEPTNNSTFIIGQYYFDDSSTATNNFFEVGDSIDGSNPFDAAEAVITDIAIDHTFYMYRYEEASVKFSLNEGLSTGGALPADTKIEFLEYDGNGYCSPGADACAVTADCSNHTSRAQCENDGNYTAGTEPLTDIHWVSTEVATPPLGLTFDTTTGHITGTPSINADKQKFIIQVTNPYGSTSHNFELKVYDHFVVAPTNTVALPMPDSFRMHQTGYGMANVPCRITQEAMNAAIAGNANAADVVDVTCIMDGGETDLFYKGLSVTIQTGDDMCTAVKHTPFYYFDWRYTQSDNAGLAETLFKNTGNYEDPLCGNQIEYTTTSTLGFTPGLTGPAGAETSAGITDGPKDICAIDYGGPMTAGGDYSVLDPVPGPNCDDGEITHSEIQWDATAFECLDAAGGATSQATAGDCYENVGSCEEDTVIGDCAAACGGDCTNCDNRADCEFGVTDNTWIDEGSHNDSSAVGVNLTIYNGTVDAWGCVASATAVTETTSCGGTKAECIGGVGSHNQGLEPDDLSARATVVTVMASGDTSTTYTYGAPDELGYSSNLAISNYMKNSAIGCMGTTAALPNSYNDFAPTDWDDYMSWGSQDPTAALVDHPFAGGHPEYSYSCDSGAGTVARVRMFVRDWDNTFSVTDDIERIFLVDDTRMDDLTADFCGVFAPCDNISDWDNFTPVATDCGNQDLDFNFGVNNSGGDFPEGRDR